MTIGITFSFMLIDYIPCAAKDINYPDKQAGWVERSVTHHFPMIVCLVEKIG